MATIIFEQVHVSQSVDTEGNKLDIYRYWKNENGSLGRFRATEHIGYGENITYQSFHFLADGKVADKLNKMNLKAGSTLYVVGELVPEVFNGKSGQIVNRVVVKIFDVRFAAGKKEKKEEKKEIPKENPKEPRRTNIPIPKETQEHKEVRQRTDIPRPSVEISEAPETTDEILNLDIHDLFSEKSGFMGIKNPSAR